MIRFFDIVLSSVAIIILLPIFLIVAILIHLEDRGPILFLQIRVGKNLKHFKIIKFRTMVHDINRFQGDYLLNMNKEELTKLRAQVSTANKSDSRITKIGRILRKTSIDELPQLFNVIIGDMSLVGPRPDTPIQEVDYKYEDWLNRHKVKPGITGLSQISGRSEITMENRVKLDIEYANTQNIFIYAKILIITFFHVITLKGIN